MSPAQNKTADVLIHPATGRRGKCKSHPLWKLFVQVAAPVFDFLWKYVMHPRRKAYAWGYRYRNSGTASANTLQTNGIDMLPSDSNFLDFALWLRARIPDDLLHRHKQRLLGDEDEQAFTVNIESELDVDTRLRMLEFGLSPEILTPTLKYFGLVPRLSGVLVLYNIPKSSLGPVGSQEWHRDEGLYKSINLFMCLSDVSDDSGAYYAISQRDIDRHAEIPFDYIDTSLSLWRRFRHSDELIRKYVPTFTALRLAGGPGSSAFVDPGLCYHRGGWCLTQDRLMLQISFTLDTPREQLGVISRLGLNRHPVVQRLRDNPFYRLLLDGNADRWYWKLGFENPVYFVSRRILAYRLPPARKGA
jgi:hypothetical protein